MCAVVRRCASLCVVHGVQYRPRHPQTNARVDRLDGRISELVSQTRFACAAAPQSMLTMGLESCKHCSPERALAHQMPIQAPKAWRKTNPN